LLLIAQALEHAKDKHGHSGEREVDADGYSPCLWDDCPVKTKVVTPSIKAAGKKPAFAPLRAHEALHEKGTRLREAFVCPHPGCVEAFGKDVDKAWEHAWKAHGIARDNRRCLWENCEKGMRDPEAKKYRFRKPSTYMDHETVRHPPPHAHSHLSRTLHLLTDTPSPPTCRSTRAGGSSCARADTAPASDGNSRISRSTRPHAKRTRPPCPRRSPAAAIEAAARRRRWRRSARTPRRAHRQRRRPSPPSPSTTSTTCTFA